MKTLDQILEGVSASGKFDAIIGPHDEVLVVNNGTLNMQRIAIPADLTSQAANFRYISWACRNAPGLADTLQQILATAEGTEPTSSLARRALAEALKD